VPTLHTKKLKALERRYGQRTELRHSREVSDLFMGRVIRNANSVENRGHAVSVEPKGTHTAVR